MQLSSSTNLSFQRKLGGFFGSVRTSAEITFVAIWLIIVGEDNMGHWRNGILSSSVEATSPATEPPGALVLGGSRTKRPNILNRFKRYHAGLNIVDKHYSTISKLL
ncbi:hypothetical protein L6452_16538 [Arctium lappa]|uniref:Uncharacterized protein n=1 Tax=Arctium lappa TaxID=4217 RepID=A0ACB9C0X1_ARCLA|nr:hypothetical protein L6452_16538 [Arctium lappa]